MGDSMPQWMQAIFAGWPMIRANLPTFFVILVLMVGAAWIVVNWSYSALLSSKNGQIELQDRQLADYREKLKGATPEEAKAKIDALEANRKPVSSLIFISIMISEKTIPTPQTHRRNVAGKNSKLRTSAIEIWLVLPMSQIWSSAANQFRLQEMKSLMSMSPIVDLERATSPPK